MRPTTLVCEPTAGLIDHERAGVSTHHTAAVITRRPPSHGGQHTAAVRPRQKEGVALRKRIGDPGPPHRSRTPSGGPRVWDETQTLLLGSAPDALLGVDQAGAIVFANAFAERMFGYAPGELDGRLIEELLPEKERAPHPAHRARYATDPTTRPMGAARQLRGRRQDGSEFPVEITLSSVNANAGKDTDTDTDTDSDRLVLAAVRDITDRRQAEEATERLAAIVASSDDAIIGKTLQGVITSWNDAAERMYGYSVHEALGAHISLLVPDSRQRELSDILERLAAGERISHLETIRRRKDGRTLDVSVTISPIRDRLGRVVGASTVARDISEGKRVQRELIAAEERFRRAFEDAPGGMALMSEDGRIEEANAALAALCGCAIADVEASRLAELLHPADVPAALEGLTALASGLRDRLRGEMRLLSQAPDRRSTCP